MEHQPLILRDRRAREPAACLRHHAADRVGNVDDHLAPAPGALGDVAVELQHRHHLRPAKLVGLAAMRARIERSHRNGVADIGNVDRLQLPLAPHHRDHR
jgi:hypothetical protein